MPLEFEYHSSSDVLTIEGVRYTGDFFRSLSEGGLPIGTVFTIESRDEDGAIILRRLQRVDVVTLLEGMAHATKG